MFGIVKAEKLLVKYKNKSIGLLMNQASFIQDGFVFTLDYLRSLGFNIRKVLAPQHGLFPITQANMIPFYSYYDNIFKIEVVSLYEEGYSFDKQKLEDLDVVFIDIQDIGARYYTYVWTSMLICETGIEVVIFDRPNPLGNKKEGIILKKEFFSFVGMKNIYNRHGMTIGQILGDYENVRVIEGDFDKSKDWYELGLKWIPTSPNIPSIESVYFYPGFALLEATNISEGRGTTYPFEVFGAPFINEEKLKKRIEYYKHKYSIQGVEFIYHRFVPTFDKYKGQVCNGLKMIITNYKTFSPIKTFLIVLKSLVDLHPTELRFNDPPYEYEYTRMPIDILWGDDSLRKNIYSERGFDCLLEMVSTDG
ncbi:MAG: DUF1343 domain-containing protein [Candidatus Calescibacterium sp.]|nr:DUF1343 domain-containing protein [Candidatus Calescibacterium sp.]MCX7972475.1 DUF1343 domain-containing protein [bacterium]MDW8195633.1 DUF1343 domain-containing protein [Candidatus Calescibacterium sp.]